MSNSKFEKNTNQGMSLNKILLLIACVAGIWVSYLSQGVLQENLSTKEFAPDNKRFEHLTFLNLAQNVVCFFWSLLMLGLWREGFNGQAPLFAYWSASISNTIGPAMGIVALKYISYPAQVLAKSSKMIPVMLMGAIIYKVKYTIPEYVCTILVAGGVGIFALFKSSSKAVKKLSHPNAPLGYFLCFLNLGLDGYTNSTQDSISEKYPKTSTYHLMLGMNLWGSIYMFIYMFLFPNGGGMEAIDFCLTHKDAAMDILLFCLCGALGQNFIFLTISNFGALANTTITTTRKFMSILISAVWNGSYLSLEQWSGVFMVFAGLSLQILLKYLKKKSHGKAASKVLGNGHMKKVE